MFFKSSYATSLHLLYIVISCSKLVEKIVYFVFTWHRI